MSRKTIEVDALIEKANFLLSTEGNHVNPSYREGICDLLESILHRTGNYRGFNYIEWMNGGASRWEAHGKPNEADSFMYGRYGRFGRYYYSSPKNEIK